MTNCYLLLQFKFQRPNGLVVRYNVTTLVTYLLASGNFFEPESRIEFSDGDLQRLDQQVKDIGLSFHSVFDAKRTPESKQQKKIANMRFERDALTGLERCCGELVVEMLHLIESQEVDMEMAEILLLTSLFPQFNDLCEQMSGTDPEYALQSIANYKIFLLGPPNRPTQDSQGLLQVCIDQFEMQQRIIKCRAEESSDSDDSDSDDSDSDSETGSSCSDSS